MHPEEETSAPTRAEGEGATTSPPGAARQVKKLVELANNVLFWDNGRLDVDSEDGRHALRLFLSALHTSSRKLRVVQAPREYHSTLSERVRATWTDADCLYHIGIMTKSVHGEVYFNSRSYPLGDDAMALSCQLCERLSELRGVLGRLHGINRESVTASDVEDVKACLVVFDEAWASFEECFFVELVGIEAKARAVLAEAVGLVSDLDRIAGNYEEDVDPKILMQDSEFVEKHCGLINCIARLNSEANPSSAARSFEPEVLQQAEAMVEDCLSRGGNHACSVFALASDAVLAWDDLCCYLYQMDQCMDWFSPNLRKNKELVKLLEAWSTSWALAEVYVVDKQGSHAMRTTLQYIQKAQTIAPSLVDMMNDQSPEFFLALPRIVLLCFLEDPMCIEPLLARLLPHRFEEQCDDSENGVTFCPRDELASFMDAYRRTWNLLAPAASSAAGPERGDVQTIVQAVLTGSIVDGVGDSSTPPTEGIFDGPAGRKAREACKSFVIRMEGWSMELQRHSAKDWNNFSSTLMRCLEPQAANTSAQAASVA